MARERRAKRARTTKQDAEGDAVAGESNAQSASNAPASNNVAAAPAVGDAVAGASNAQSASNAPASDNVAAAPAVGDDMSIVEATIAAGAFDVLPDDLVKNILHLAARRGPLKPESDKPSAAAEQREENDTPPAKEKESDKPSPRVCKGHSPLEPAGAEPDVSPARLAALKAICRRFRRLADEAGEQLQARVVHVMQQPNEAAAAVKALASLPKSVQATVRRVAVREGSLTRTGFRTLFAALRQQLVEFHLTISSDFDIDRQRPTASTQAQVTAIAALWHLSGLRSLYIGLNPDSTVWPGIFSAPSFLKPLSVLQRLDGLQELELNMPLPVSVLEGLVGTLAPSLRALTFEAAVRNETPPAALFEVAGRLPLLERLDLSFFDEDMCKRDWPIARWSDLRFLCALQHMKSLELCCNLDWLGFLKCMPKLEHMTANVRGDVDAGPVAAAKSLRSVTLSNAGSNAADVSQPWSFLEAITGLKTLEALQLQLHTACFEHLAKTDLSAWGAGLSRLVVGMNEDNGATLPASLLKRLASDVPSLRVLETYMHCPLPVSSDLPAISRLSFLKELVVDKAVLEKYELGESQREQLRSVLLDVHITFKDEQA